MLPITKQDQIVTQIQGLNPQQFENVMDYITMIVETRKLKNKRLKRKALVQIRKALRKGL